MNKFKCDICQEHHDYYESFIGEEPLILSNMSPDEKKQRVVSHGYLQLIDKAFMLVPSDLFIKKQNSKEHIHWHIWTKINPHDYIKSAENLDVEIAYVEGEIYEEIPFYKNSAGIKIRLKFYLNQKVDYPEVEILNKRFELGRDFNEGLSDEKLIDWMKQIYHPAI